jgi:hypothetical protein
LRRLDYRNGPTKCQRLLPIEVVPRGGDWPVFRAGIALAGASGLAQVSALLSAMLGEPEQRVFQRLREWYLDKEQKSGKKRRELDVTTCFAPRLAMGSASDGGAAGRETSAGVGVGCDQPAQSVDHPSGERTGGWLCRSGGEDASFLLNKKGPGVPIGKRGFPGLVQAFLPTGR